MVTLGAGLSERGVALFYERHLAGGQGTLLTRRLEDRIVATLAVLEADRNARRTPWWFGEHIGHADIAVACGLSHLAEALPDQWDKASHPALARHCAVAEALPVFQEIGQPFVGPGGPPA